jgi:hypothetical protein
VNNVKINEDPNDKIIRILKDEIETLQRKLKLSIPGTADNSAIADELKQREQLMAEKEKTWEQRLTESQQANLVLQAQLKHELEQKQAEFQKQIELMNNEKQKLIEDMEDAKKSISTRAIEEQRKIEEHYEKKQQAFEQVRIIETATTLQEYYEKKLELLRQQYEEKLQARDAKDAQTTVFEIEKLKQNNQLLKDTLTQNQINLQTQMRQFTLERGLLSKQIQQLHAKIHLLEHDLTEEQLKMSKEYEFIKQKRDDEEKRFQSLQVDYKALADKIEHDGKLLDELNSKHNLVLKEIESSNKNLVMIKREYADLQARFEADKDEYNLLLIKKEELHTEILHLKTELDMHVMRAKEKLKNPTHEDLIKIRDGFEQIFSNLKSIKKT